MPDDQSPDTKSSSELARLRLKFALAKLAGDMIELSINLGNIKYILQRDNEKTEVESGRR